MKIGTFRCWLWGHKFLKIFTVDGAPGYNDIPSGYTETIVKQTDYCVRCGKDKE